MNETFDNNQSTLYSKCVSIWVKFVTSHPIDVIDCNGTFHWMNFRYIELPKSVVCKRANSEPNSMSHDT